MPDSWAREVIEAAGLPDARTLADVEAALEILAFTLHGRADLFVAPVRAEALRTIHELTRSGRVRAEEAA